MKKSAEFWIDALELEAHPEGGYFREIYRSSAQIDNTALPGKYQGPRAYATLIYYLLREGEISVLHRLTSDELWHFLDGDSLSVYHIDAGGTLGCLKLGREPGDGQVLQGVIPAGNWFGSNVEPPGGYALVGCTVAPGFEFEDFEIGERRELLRRFPQHEDVILKLTR